METFRSVELVAKLQIIDKKVQVHVHCISKLGDRSSIGAMF